MHDYFIVAVKRPEAVKLGRGMLNITAIVLAATVIQSVDQGNRTLLDPA